MPGKNPPGTLKRQLIMVAFIIVAVICLGYYFAFVY